jgi:hypothetical protein
MSSRKTLIQFGKIRSCDAIEILWILQKQNINIPIYNFRKEGNPILFAKDVG